MRHGWRPGAKALRDSVGLPVDRAAFSSGRGGAGEAPLCVFRPGAVLTVVVGHGGGAGGRGGGGRGLGLLLKVRYDDCEVTNRHLKVLSAAAVDVF